MAKVFKIIMNILIILFILALVALFVPPLLGITTATARPGTATNMQIGSVAYGTRHPISELNVGDTIITNTDDSTYLYEITGIDPDTGEITARTSADAQPEILSLRRTASKKFVVIPLIGYIIIALQSTEGMIILGLSAALLIILFIIADILSRKSKKNDAAEAEVEEAEDRQYFNDLAASQSRPSRLDDLGTIAIPPVSDIMKENAAASQAALDEEVEAPASDDESTAKTETKAKASKKSSSKGKSSHNTSTLMYVDLVEPEPSDDEPAADIEPAADGETREEPEFAEGTPEDGAFVAAPEAGSGEVIITPAETAENEVIITPAEAEKDKLFTAPAEATKEESFTKTVKEEPFTKAVKEEPFTETVKEESFTKAVKEEPFIDAVKEEPFTKAVKEEPFIDAVKEDSFTKAAAEEAAAEVVTDEAFVAAAEASALSRTPASNVPDTPGQYSNTAVVSGISSALENALDTEDFGKQQEPAAPAAPVPEPEQEIKPEEIELAIPQRTLDELLQEAYANGEDPKVTKDPTTGITFVDFSNCL